ncbi:MULTISPECIES: tol-pal system-associated acyl-CoA thioesterase [Vibrio]|uniref:Tol-pal system-associated acyl-CoA thioesterase n=1 Tax=Vibrio chanodichtyis TaxID=3027932 RepID=A0ABT5UW27_9VIBR|nr:MULTISPECIES: tol-pal system-associated acyl-CoA thioesterase [Vibrio]MDE1513626.1 tol-pal system-associated acyl-CoA thioesterase [Vibrio chanodichtyis]QIL86284.1 tol-pal system-associated acyl-CoA thioesterase [Vibrio sp. HDW18]
MKTFRWPVTVYYEDTDAGGVVYHANYLKFFERARTEMLRAFGVNQQSLLQQNTGFVVRHMEIDFLKGAKLDDHLEVITYVSELRKASLTFCQELVNPDGAVLSKAKVKVACIDHENMRPKALPQLISLEFNGSER